jgi:CAAX prenyl protease-like protein
MNFPTSRIFRPSSPSSPAYVAPFAAFLVFLGARNLIAGGPAVEYPLRVVVVAAVALVFSRHVLSFRTSRPLASAALGTAVFVVWIGPDLMFPQLREHWLFDNPVTGTARSSLPAEVRGSLWFLAWRTAGCALLVPVIEELFWRAWLMRRLVAADFRSVPLGAYSALSFWATAILFACEHGPYWDVGLLAGMAYNWWMVRTRSLGDCILAHAVTNACLAAWVVSTGQFQYWL